MPLPDPVIEAYKSGVDRTLLRENLKLSPQQRFDKFTGVMQNLMNLRAAGQRSRELKMARQTSSQSSSAGGTIES